MFKRFFKISAWATVSLAMIVACSKKTTAPASQKTYQGPQISYASDVAPIIKRSCSPCHFPAQNGKKDPLDSYKSMQKEIIEVIARVEMDEDNIKFMPYKKKKQSLSKDEIKLLKNWAQGGFLE